MLTPLGEHELLVFWIEFALLLVVARVLGGMLQRLGQPAVVGELGAGLLLGPSIFGRLFPGLAAEIFPGGEVQSAMLLVVAWIGIVLLLTVTGVETDLRLLRRLGRESAGVAIGSLVVPLVLGLGLGLLLPDAYMGEGTNRPIFAAFMAVALSISALPVIARILQDLQLVRRNFGQITLAAGMVNDVVGWLLLGVLIGIVHTGGFDAGALVRMLVAITVFVGLIMTVGQRAFDETIRFVRRTSSSHVTASLTVTLAMVLVAGAITHWIGMEAVIGAFVAGIVLGRSRFVPRETIRAVERMSHAVFAPIFFATAGLYVDLGTLSSVDAALAAGAVLAVAVVGKFVGSYVGGRISALTSGESIAAAIGLNARGAMEIVLATIGLGLGVLNDTSYTAVVLMAMLTSLAAPPLLKPVLARLRPSEEEAARLEREELLEASVIANVSNALIPTRGGQNSLMATRFVDLMLPEGAVTTILTVDPPGGPTPDRREEQAERVSVLLGPREHERRQVRDEDPAAAILGEARLGYDLLALGLNEEFRGTHRLSETLKRLLAGADIPVLLVRRPLATQDPSGLEDFPIGRVTVPVTGTPTGLAAEEVAYVVAGRLGAEVDAVHVVSRGDVPDGDRDGDPDAPPSAARQMLRTRELARRFGQGTSALIRTAPLPYEELLVTAEERASDLLVVGTQLRTHEDQPFLGHGTEYLLEHATQGVVVIVFP